MVEKKEQIAKIGEEAFSYFMSFKGNCTEAILLTLRDHLNLPLSDEQLAIATGFGGGMGSGCSCGTLTGAIMAVSLETGRKPGVPSENPPRASVLAHQMVQGFTERHGATCCRALIPGLKKGSPERMDHCSKLVREMSQEAARIILDERSAAKLTK